MSIPTAEDNSSGFSRLIHGLLPVKRNEVLTVALLTLNVFALLTVYYILKVVREPLILTGGGAELKAYASAGQTILLLGVVPAFGWLSNRVSRIRLMTTMGIIFIGCLAAFYLLYTANAPIGLAFYLWVGIFNVLVISNFWSFCNDLFEEEEGKRLFGVIGIGASIGAILGAFVPHILHDLMGVAGLMALAAGGLGASIFLYHVVDRREASKKKEVEKTEDAPIAKDKKGGFALVMKDKYLRTIAFMLLTATIINTTGEYVIGKLATDQAKAYAADKVAHAQPAAPTPDAPKAKAEGGKKKEKTPQELAESDYLNDFFADYYGVINVVSFLLQALLVARIMTKLGIRKALFIMPLIVLGGWFALIIFTTMATVRIEKTSENSLDYSLHNTLRQALFLPTSAEAKYKAKAAIDTFFFRMGDVIAGMGIVFLFVEVFGLGIKAFAVLNVLLALVWLMLVNSAGKQHQELAAKKHQKAA